MKVRNRVPLIVLLASIIALGTLTFVFAAPLDYDRSTGGQHQIREMTISDSGNTGLSLSFKLAHATRNAVKVTVEVLDSSTTPIYQGERLVKDESLGKYVVALTLIDTRLQKDVKSKLNLQGMQIPDARHIVSHIRVAYPPDDSMLVIYVGCKSKPAVSTSEKDNVLTLSVQPE